MLKSADANEKITELAQKEFGLDNNLNEISIRAEYNKLRDIVTANFDDRVWFLLDACLAVVASLMIEDLPNPIGLNLVDGPSSEKTTVLSMFYGLPLVYRCDSFTPASFVSHAANRSERQLKQADLLPRIRHKCIIVPELAPIFGASREDLLKNFSILTRIFDGEGLMTDSGSHGRRGYEGDYHFAWLGATTPIPQVVWNTMGQLGSRLLFLTADSRRSQFDRVSKAVGNLKSIMPYKKRVAVCREAVNSFIALLTAKQTNGEYYRAIKWDILHDDFNVINKIGILAELTARARSRVAVWGDNDRDRSDEKFTQPIIEGPERIISILYGLARGHAIINGRRTVTEEDLPLVIAVALSSMPDDRRQVIDLMIDPDNPDKESPRGQVTSTELAEILTFSKPTALDTMKKIGLLNIGKNDDGSGPMPSKLILNDFYGWLLTDEFSALRRIWDSETKQEYVPF